MYINSMTGVIMNRAAQDCGTNTPGKTHNAASLRITDVIIPDNGRHRKIGIVIFDAQIDFPAIVNPRALYNLPVARLEDRQTVALCAKDITTRDQAGFIPQDDVVDAIAHNAFAHLVICGVIVVHAPPTPRKVINALKDYAVRT